MLRNPMINALSQVEDILNVTASLSSSVQSVFYVEAGAGRHVRHILDHLLALREGMESGILDYNRRNRESIIERDLQAATQQLQELRAWLEQQGKFEGSIEIISEADVGNTVNIEMPSTVQREVLYIINHTIHHAAHIKLLGKHMDIQFPEHIGLAPATATYFRHGGPTCAPSA